MTKFIFDGYFDHILNSFGWQNIEIGITHQSKYLIILTQVNMLH